MLRPWWVPAGSEEVEQVLGLHRFSGKRGSPRGMLRTVRNVKSTAQATRRRARCRPLSPRPGAPLLGFVPSHVQVARAARRVLHRPNVHPTFPFILAMVFANSSTDIGSVVELSRWRARWHDGQSAARSVAGTVFVFAGSVAKNRR